MGAWGIGIFDNDDACDWIDELIEEDDIDFICSTFKKIGSGIDDTLLSRMLEEKKELYIEEPEGSAILAAAEIVAALNGKAGKDIPEEAIAWIEENMENSTQELLSLAKTAVKSVRENSELRELWEESDDMEGWLAEVEDLENRL